MSKCKFKVGDMVKAIDDFYTFTNARNHFEGEVTEIDKDGDLTVRCTKCDKYSYIHTWYWLNPNHFDLISNPEIHITVKGNETIAVYKNGDEQKMAVAKCCPEDTFDFAIGAKIALDRLGVLPTEPKEEVQKESEYYNGKVVCIKSGYSWWTVGKVYDVVDGYITADDGDVFPKKGYRYTSAEDVKHAGNLSKLYGGDDKHNPKNEFIPLVEDETPLKLVEVKDGRDYGICGTPTKFKDKNGEPLFVGDVVDVFNPLGHCVGDSIVVESALSYADGKVKQFVRGIEIACNDKTGKIKGWKVEKVKSYKDCKAGDVVHDTKYV